MPPPIDTPPLPLMLSAHAAESLRALAAAYGAHLEAGMAWNELAAAAAHQRPWRDHRALIRPASREEGIAALKLLAADESSPALMKGETVDEHGRLALIFSGNGSQWVNMGQRLLAEEPAFRRAFAEIDALWREDGSPSLLEAMRAGVDATWLAATEQAQPLLFAMQVALVEVLTAQGLQYDVCAGHSVGEAAAAWATGALSLPQAVHLIKYRSRAQGASRGAGRMAAASINEAEAEQLIQQLGLTAELTVAGVNSPQSVTLAGSLQGLLQCQQRLKAEKRFFQLLDLDYAFHSDRIDAIQPQVLTDLADLRPRPTRLPFISTVTGDLLEGTALDADYWWRNVRQPVRFEAAIRRMITDGIRLFVEVSPHPILRTYIRQTLTVEQAAGRVLPLLKRHHDTASALHQAIAAILVAGARIDPARRYPKPATQTVA